MLVDGAEAVVPVSCHGTQDSILSTSALGVPDLIHNYSLRPLNEADKKDEKIIVYTTFAKFHGYMSKVCWHVGFEIVIYSQLTFGRRWRPLA